MHRVTANVASSPDRFKADLVTIAENFDRRARDLLEHYNNSHQSGKQERYGRMLTAYTIWRDAARVLEGIANGHITVEQLRRVTERGKEK